MNKNLYRIVFNKARGMLMVVADIARSGRAGSSRSSGIGHNHSRLVGKVSALSFSLWLAMGVVHTAQADIIADAGAPKNQQPTVLNSANGTTQVNIQTPSAAGVSRNNYSKFDVSQQGAILNNSHKNVQTQLGGMVTGNPWLAFALPMAVGVVGVVVFCAVVREPDNRDAPAPAPQRIAASAAASRTRGWSARPR